MYAKTQMIQVLELHRGYDLPEKDRHEGTVPVISSAGYSGSHDQYKCEGENVITGRYGTIGEVFYHEGKCWPLNTALYVSNFKGNYPRYVYYLLKYVLKSATDGKDKSTVPGVDRNVLHQMNIPFCDEIRAQKKMVRILVDIDKKIETNIKINDNLAQQLRLLYDYWFTQFDFPDENGNPYRSSGGQMVWNEHLKREIPQNWGSTSIGNITNCLDSSRIPLSNQQRQEMKGLVPYYGATGIMDYVNRPIFSGDFVLLAEDGSVMDEKGNPILQRVSGDVWINNHAHVLQPVDGYSCCLLYLLLKDIPVVLIKTGSIQLKINQANLNSYKVLNIPEWIRTRFINLTEPLDAKIIQIQRENQQLIALRDWLLPMLMNGQATISD